MTSLLLMSVSKNIVKVKLVGGQFTPQANKGTPFKKSFGNVSYNQYFRSEGEKVRVGDDLILVSVATERYLVTTIT